MTAVIQALEAYEILDSRGYPTLRVRASLDNGHARTASVPSGASTGRYEALELCDGDMTRYRGKGVLKAVSHVNGIIQDRLLGLAAAFPRAYRHDIACPRRHREQEQTGCECCPWRHPDAHLAERLCGENARKPAHLLHDVLDPLLGKAGRRVLPVCEEVGHVDQLLHGVPREQRDDENRGGEHHPERRERGTDRCRAMLRIIMSGGCDTNWSSWMLSGSSLR